MRSSRWTQAEDEAIRQAYPDYDLLQKRLTHRTYFALRARARTLGVAQKRHVWTNREVKLLLAACARGATDAELLDVFPALRLAQIKAMARHRGALRQRPRFVVMGVPALDAIRQRAAASGMSLIDLDRVLSTDMYFQKSRRDVMLQPVKRAAEFFGGRIDISWDDWR